MAERDQLARPLAAHDAGELGDAEDVALRAAAVDDQAHRLRRDGDERLGDGAPGGHRLVADVDHPRPARTDRRGSGGDARARGRSGPCLLRTDGRPMVAGSRPTHAQISPRRATTARRPRRRRADRPPPGTTARRVRGGERREDVAPLPRLAAGQADLDAARLVAHRRAVRRLAPRRPGGSRAGPGSSDRRRAGPRGRPVAGAGPAGGPRAPGSRAGRTARTSRSSRPGCRAGRTAAPCRRPAARRCRTRTACPAGPRPARASIRPIFSNASLTTSYGPTDTPPETTIASAPAARAAHSRDSTSSSRSGAIPRSCGSAPASATSAASPGPFASGMPAGPRS